MLKPIAEARGATSKMFGFSKAMEGVLVELVGKHITVRSVNNHLIKFVGDGGYAWNVASFVAVDVTTEQGFKAGSKIVRSTRFTDSFVDGEVHTVDRVSDCGQYLWVYGHRHKVPERYFKAYVVAPSAIAEPPELTDFSERTVGDNLRGCGLVAKTEPVPPPESPEAYTARTGYRKFKAGDEVKQLDGGRDFIVHDVSPCGYKFRAKDWTIRYGWMLMKDFELAENELVNRDIVAGLILQGVAVQYRNLGEWFDVQPNTLTVAMIGRLDFRVNPLTMDYYGNEIPASVDVLKTKVKTVWGVSLNNNKIYPCALGTARVNKSKGHGLYWETESQAQQVFDILMKPFNGATK